MDAMVVDPAGALRPARVPLPALGDHDILLEVAACGVCRTDLHIIDGDLLGAPVEQPPQPLGAAIIFAPVGTLIPAALAASAKGATIVCAGIHMSDIPSMPYALLWGERSVRSVANLTRKDGEDFFRLAEQHELRTVPVPFPLAAASEALRDLRQGRFDGAAVLVPTPTTREG